MRWGVLVAGVKGVGLLVVATMLLYLMVVFLQVRGTWHGQHGEAAIETSAKFLRLPVSAIERARLSGRYGLRSGPFLYEITTHEDVRRHLIERFGLEEGVGEPGRIAKSPAWWREAVAAVFPAMTSYVDERESVHLWISPDGRTVYLRFSPG